MYKALRRLSFDNDKPNLNSKPIPQMRTNLYYLFSLSLIMFCFACKSDKTSSTSEYEVEATASLSAPFSVIITEDTSRPHLPDLQSFVLATSGDTWLMMAGRTNGMHKFADYEENSFPHADFNDMIFVCDASNCNSMSVTNIPMPYQSIFRATNLQHYQDGNDLYITGGYGENPLLSNILERWDTYDYMAKIDVSAMMAAVNNNDPTALNHSIVFGQSPVVEATGGELFKMNDFFYLTAGHKYNGIFSHDTSAHFPDPTQVYLDAVHRFKIVESNNTLAITEFTKITDGLADNLTQFRRRDLPVLTGLAYNNGVLEQSITLFAGVFTSPDNKIVGLKPDEAFTKPIQIFNNGTYKIDDTYEQSQNIYATARFTAYDSNTQAIYSTMIGGIGEKKNSHSFTNKVLTVNTPLMGGTTTETVQDSIQTSNLFGAESNMIFSSANKVIGSDDVFDISNMNSGDVMSIGMFYGGIEAEVANPSGFGPGLSKASNKLWSVSIKKN